MNGDSVEDKGFKEDIAKGFATNPLNSDVVDETGFVDGPAQWFRMDRGERQHVAVQTEVCQVSDAEVPAGAADACSLQWFHEELRAKEASLDEARLVLEELQHRIGELERQQRR